MSAAPAWCAADDAPDDAPPGRDLLDRPDWQDDAACRGSDLAKFFATRRGWSAENRAAKATCRCCPVRQACLDFALLTHQRHGIWGGLSERERRGLAPGDPVEVFDCGECA